MVTKQQALEILSVLRADGKTPDGYGRISADSFLEALDAAGAFAVEPAPAEDLGPHMKNGEARKP